MPISQIGLTPPQRKTLEFFEYNPTTDQLQGEKAIGTTLNSIFLGGHHQASSGDENVFWTNLTTNINYFPAWGGLKDQEVPANQDYSGIREVSARVYSDNLLFLEPDGAIGGNIVDYNSVDTNAENFSVHGIKVRLGQNLDVGNIVAYRLYLGSDNTGTQIYEQDFRVESPIVSGEFLEFWFNHPSEDFAGATIYAEATVIPFQNAEVALHTPLRVYSTLTNTALRWYELRYRNFTDRELAREELLLPLHVDSAFTIQQNGREYSVDTSGGPVTLTVDETRSKSFTVQDETASFATNNCTVVIGVDSYILDKNQKGYQFHYDAENTVWRYIELHRKVVH